ncbi:MAG: HAMP domain-containing histidine kinase [Acidimicrobiia bacterium]|nr:HAMP domain-containing histidine kinase [Acidimicrobiia bacterium]
MTTAVILYGAARSMLRDAARTDDALFQERRANELKNEFVSMVSHELRTPLTSIAGFIDTLRVAWRELPEDEVEEFLRIVTDEASHLSQLVEDILVIPRLEAGRLPLHTVDFDPREDVYASIEAIFPNGSTTREIEIAMPGAIQVRADRSRMKQVLRNLLENARKYGGDEVYVEVGLTDSGAVFVVADNGPGVPETDRHRIFEPFEQVGKGDNREASGVGLGLPIASQLVTAMGGRMWYEQSFPRGARFCFSLPLAGSMQPVAESTTT